MSPSDGVTRDTLRRSGTPRPERVTSSTWYTASPLRVRAWSEAACREHWRGKIGRDDVVLVDRPGRGYGDDYSPWLVEAPVGELVRVRGRDVVPEGILAA